MYQRKMSLQNNNGQILIEALVASFLMVLIMLAFSNLIELKKSQRKVFKPIENRIESLNGKTIKSQPAE